MAVDLTAEEYNVGSSWVIH